MGQKQANPALDQLIFENINFQIGEQEILVNIKAIEGFLKNKLAELRLFQMKRIIGYETVQKKEIGVYQKTSSLGCSGLSKLFTMNVSPNHKNKHNTITITRLYNICSSLRLRVFISLVLFLLRDRGFVIGERI